MSRLLWWTARNLFAALSIFSALFGSFFNFQSSPNSRISAEISRQQISPLAGTRSPLARGEFESGRLDPAFKLEGVSLEIQPTAAQQADLDSLLADQQNPASPNFHKWLTPEEYADRFGLSTADIAKIKSWLESESFTDISVNRSRTQISFTGNVAQIESVFSTQMHYYTIKGESHFANSTDVSIPSSLVGIVRHVGHLNTFRPHPKIVNPHTVAASPNFTSNISGNHFLVPEDWATIYDVKPLYNSGIDGTGQKIAVVGQTLINLSDVQAFRSAAGLAAKDPTLTLVPNTGASAHLNANDEFESDLDVEWTGGIARNATIIFVYTGNSPTSSGAFGALAYAVDQNLAPVISVSYGACEASEGMNNASQLRTLVQQANTQGQTILAAAGDAGAADCENSTATSATHGYAVDLPASIPEVTGMGGTMFTGDPGSLSSTTYWNGTNDSQNGSAISYIPEIVWNEPNTTSLAAGGGGASTFFTKPTWQTGTGVPNDGQRDVPDVSFNSASGHDSYLLCNAGKCVNGFRNTDKSLTTVGGTSAAAPTFAGVIALLNQYKASTGQGNINPTLYTLAGTNPSVFHDITTGNNDVPCTSGTTNCTMAGQTFIGFTATVGYDQASGLGSMDVFNFFTALGAGGTPAFSFAPSPTSFTVTAGSAPTSTLTFTGTNGYAGTLNLTCSAPAATAKITCGFSPASVTLSAANPSATSNFTITTTAPHAIAGTKSLLLPPFQSGPLSNGTGTAAFACFAIVLLAALFYVPKKFKLLPAAVGIAVLFAVTGCGGGGSSVTPGTPAGTYTIQVTATDAATSKTQTTNITVTVN